MRRRRTRPATWWGRAASRRARRGWTGRRVLTGLGIACLLTLGLQAMGRRAEPAQADPVQGPDAPTVAKRVAPSVSATPAAAPTSGLTSGPAQAVETTGEEPERWFNGRPIRRVRTLRMRVTAYSPDARSCGRFADGITASGYSVWTNGMNLAAADPALLAAGSLVSVPGYDDGNVVPVLDRGGRIKGHRLDVLFPSHERALQWGVQELDVRVWEYADGLPNDFQSGW